MKSFTTYLTLIAALSLETKAADCQNAPGVANGECVTYYKSSGGSGCGLKLGSYKPTCSGNCFVYNSFDGIKASGDGTYGTNCYIYSDTGCNNYLGQTGNTVSVGGCSTFAGAKAMKCYYRC